MFKNKGIRITSYVLIAVFLTLFLAFSLTYDFTSKKAYVFNESREELREELSKEMNSAIDKSKTLNVLNLSLSDDVINKFLNSTIERDNDDYLLESEYWKLRGIKIRFRGNTIVLTLYLTFTDKISYRMKINCFFDFTETRDEYILNLKRINFGSIVVPSFLTRTILSNNEANSVGDIIENSVESLNLGTYDKEKLTYTINKTELCESIATGTIGEAAFDDNTTIKAATALYFQLLNSKDAIHVGISKTLNIIVDYSSFINVETAISSDIEYAKSNGKNGYKSMEDVLILDYLMNGSNIILSSDYQTALINKNIVVEKEEDSIFSFNLITFESYSNIVKLRVISVFSGKNSVIELIFKESDPGTFTLNRITIGYDEGETQGTYIEINRTIDLIRAFNLLALFNINLSQTSNNLDYESLFSDTRIPYLSIEINNGSLIIKTKTNSYKSDITSGILSLDFQNYLNEELRNKIDFSTTDAILSSFKALNIESRDLFLKYSLQYFKEKDEAVYNYISGIIEGGSKWLPILLKI